MSDENEIVRSVRDRGATRQLSRSGVGESSLKAWKKGRGKKSKSLEWTLHSLYFCDGTRVELSVFSFSAFFVSSFQWNSEFVGETDLPSLFGRDLAWSDKGCQVFPRRGTRKLKIAISCEEKVVSSFQTNAIRYSNCECTQTIDSLWTNLLIRLTSPDVTTWKMRNFIEKWLNISKSSRQKFEKTILTTNHPTIISRKGRQIWLVSRVCICAFTYPHLLPLSV